MATESTSAEPPSSGGPIDPQATATFQIAKLLSGPLDLRTLSLLGLFLIALFFTLQLARGLFLPIVVAVLLAFLLDPTVSFFGRRGIPRALASALVMLSFLGLLGFGLERSVQPARDMIEQAPSKLRQVERKVKRLMKPVEEVSQAAREVERLTQMQGGGRSSVEVNNDPSLGRSLFASTQSIVLGSGVVLILTFFLLSSGDLFLRKLVRMLPKMKDRKKVVTITRQIQQDVSRHLQTIAAINLLLGICVGVATYFIGLANPVLWAVMAALLNFVPYLGAVAGTLILTGVSVLTFDEPFHALLAPAVYLTLTALEGSLITPMVLGRRLSLNPVVIFVGLFFWSWIWGIAGALLAVPLLLSFKIVCDHLEPLQPIGELLGR